MAGVGASEEALLSAYIKCGGAYEKTVETISPPKPSKVLKGKSKKK